MEKKLKFKEKYKESDFLGKGKAGSVFKVEKKVKSPA